MLCANCGSRAEKGFTTSVTDLGNCLIIIRQLPESVTLVVKPFSALEPQVAHNIISSSLF